MNPMTAAVAGAVLSGIAMYTVGNRAAAVDASAERPAVIGMVDQGALSGAQPAALTTPPAVALQQQPAVAPRPRARRVSTAPPKAANVTAPRPVVREVPEPKRSWKKTALIIGGASGAGAGIGALVNGKSGALIGAAIGGGAATVYEVGKRR